VIDSHPRVGRKAAIEEIVEGFIEDISDGIRGFSAVVQFETATSHFPLHPVRISAKL